MDAPCHFLSVQTGMEAFPLELSVGRARVIGIPEGCSSIGKKELENKGIEPGDRILFKTKNSSEHWENKEFQPHFTGLSAAGAQFLVDRGVSLVGIDYLSIGVFEGDGAETHKVLLHSGIWILEGLYLGAVDEGEYELVCLPLKVEGSDGAPTRAILRRWAKQT
jgi:arylformamidase